MKPDAPVKAQRGWSIIVAREFAITGLACWRRPRRRLAAEQFWQAQDASQIACLIALLVVDACQEGRWHCGISSRRGRPPCRNHVWVTVALTLASGGDLPLAQPRIYLDDMVEPIYDYEGDYTIYARCLKCCDILSAEITKRINLLPATASRQHLAEISKAIIC